MKQNKENSQKYWEIIKYKNYEIKIIKQEKGKPDNLIINIPQFKEYEIILGWDTEFRNKEWELELEKQLKLANITDLETLKKELTKIDQKRTKNSLFNEIISHQITAYSKDKDEYIEIIIYLYNKKEKNFYKRIELSRILSITMEKLGYQWAEINNKSILLTAHYSVAEFSTLAYGDRDKLINNLQIIQKTLSSTKKFKWEIYKFDCEIEKNNENWKKNIEKKIINLQWRDTILLAPQGYKSLKKLATQTSQAKVEIEEDNYINILNLLAIKSEKDEFENKFEEYAINDTRITLEFYCKFMKTFYEIKKVNKLPITASATTELNILAHWKEDERKFKKLGWIPKDCNLTELICGKKEGKMMIERENVEGFVNRAYLGGKNNIARYYKHFCMREKRKIAFDIDISGCYSKPFPLIAIPDWEKRRRPSWKEIQEDTNKPIEKIKIGLFYVNFKFKKDIFEPYIPQKTEWGILYTLEGKTRVTYPELLKAVKLGAVKEKDIIDGYVHDDYLINGEPYFPFKGYVKEMQERRGEYRKGSFENLLFKLQVNALYGKVGQGIEIRTINNLGNINKKNSEKEYLKPSRISNAEYASHITAIARNTLTEIINEIENYPGCEVVHWTTDGLVFTMNLDAPGSIWKGQEYPEFKVWKEGEEYTDEFGTRNLDEIKDENIIGKIKDLKEIKEINPILYEKLKSLNFVKTMIKGGELLGEKADKWLEVKSIGNCIGSETTRGNWLTWEHNTQAIARGNLGSSIINNVSDFEKYTLSDEVIETIKDNLIDIKSMIKEKVDLTTIKKKEVKEKGKIYYHQSYRKVNTGPDGKRKVLEDGINTGPFRTIQDGRRYRMIIEEMTKNEIRKTPANVVFRVKTAEKEGIKYRGKSKEETVIRVVTSIALQENLITKYTYSEIANILNEKYQKYLVKEKIDENGKIIKKGIDKESLKSWKKRRVLYQSLPKEGVEKIVKEIANFLEIDLAKLELENYLF